MPLQFFVMVSLTFAASLSDKNTSIPPFEMPVAEGFAATTILRLVREIESFRYESQKALGNSSYNAKIAGEERMMLWGCGG